MILTNKTSPGKIQVMVEVFKTNVRNSSIAHSFLVAIHKQFPHYKANFDLDDRDRILRVASTDGPVQIELLLDILMNWDIDAEILPDEIPAFENLSIPIQYATDEYK